MGKFKELATEIENTKVMLERLNPLDDPEECNCDQALELDAALQVAVNFGVAAEEEIEDLKKLTSRFIEIVIDNGVLTEEDLFNDYGILLTKLPDESEFH